MEIKVYDCCLGTSSFDVRQSWCPVPPQLAGLQGLPDRFTKVIEREEIADAVRAFMSE